MVSFSIIIPVYNVEQYLDQCVGSVVSQSYRNFEVILVDDGSLDGSGALCDAWAARDARIRVIHQENQGLSGARNTGIRAAIGDYLMFLDSDDWWSNDSVLETVACRLEKTGADVLSFSYQKVYGSRQEGSYYGTLADAPAELPAEESLAYMMEQGVWITGACNKAVRRTTVVDNGLYFRLKITSEDIDWTLRLAISARFFDFINLCVFQYRQRGTSISHKTTLQRVEGMCANVDECLALLSAAPSEKAALLRPFVAYQYATVVFNYAGLSKNERTAAVTQRVRGMRHLLKESQNSKVRLMDLCCSVFGFSGTVWLVRCWEVLRNICTGGTVS